MITTLIDNFGMLGALIAMFGCMFMGWVLMHLGL